MRHRWHHGVAILAAFVLFVVLAGGCGGSGSSSDDGPVAQRKGDLVGTLHGELAEYLREELGLDPALTDLSGSVDDLADLVMLSDPDGVKASHPGLALLKEAFEGRRAVGLENVGEEEINALLDKLDMGISFRMPESMDQIELFAARRVGGDNWWFVDGGGEPAADEDDGGAARLRGRVKNFLAWVKETKEAEADTSSKPSVFTSAANDDITQLAEADIWSIPFSDRGQTFTIRYDMYSCHSFTDDSDYYYVTQSAHLNPSVRWNNVDGHQDGLATYWAQQWGHMRRYLFKNYWYDDPGNAAPLVQSSPETANNVSTITSGVTWSLGGSIGLSGSLGADMTGPKGEVGANGSLSMGVSISSSRSVNVADCSVNDKCGSEGMARLAAWEYTFADPANGERHIFWTDLEDAPMLSRSNFQPVNQWIWTVPSAFSKKVKDFKSEFTWTSGHSNGALNEAWIEVKHATHEDDDWVYHGFWVPVKRPPLLAISAAQMQFEAKGESKALTLVSALDWTASTDSDWLEINETSGKATGAGGWTLYITVDPNDGSANREGYVTLRSTDGTETQKVKVFQSRY